MHTLLSSRMVSSRTAVSVGCRGMGVWGYGRKIILPYSHAPTHPYVLFVLVVFALSLGTAAAQMPDAIPLPEHPRPDFERPAWVNLNGPWDFRFDAEDIGLGETWYDDAADFPRAITVPFSWAAPLSGLTDEADIGWYARSVTVPEAWAGRRVFLVVGAADWHTTAWIDGQTLGSHRGGYTPFAFEVTEQARPGEAQRLVLRVDDTPHPFKLEGKQGYGAARGIWQTPYLEARGAAPFDVLHFTPDVQASTVTVTAVLLEPAPVPLTLHLTFETGGVAEVSQPVPQGADRITFEVPIPDARLWTLDDPFLYEVVARLGAPGYAEDVVNTYFGMREISVVDLPGTDMPYVALNGEPVYLQLALDQAYHPDGFYTFPSDAFMRDEILRSRRIGLNGQRIHVKVGLPRKLYWADRLGLLIMADVPNSWGEPDAEMRREVEYALREMIKRDYNHPSIFSWVPFNETWGLVTRREVAGETRHDYLPETQDWVVSVYETAKALDPTRLVEDNSVCCGRGHTATDLNSWHAYLPGWEWEAYLGQISDSTFEGSGWNFERRYRQGRQPNINSEFGNVWGYEGSTGDVDWSWDYHRAVNEFRRHPRIAGWLYTEHHDVVNEWNGYWRFDRTEKETGLGALVEGMTLSDLHAPFYISTGGQLSRAVQAGATVQVPLFASFMADRPAYGETLTLHATLYGWNTVGEKKTYYETRRAVPNRPWMQAALDPLPVPMPEEPAVAVLALRLEDAGGTVLHRNVTTFVVQGALPEVVHLASGHPARLVRVAPDAFAEAAWSRKQWDVLDGLKVNGAGAGYFEYRFPWPEGVQPSDLATATLRVEASAKQLFGKDRDEDDRIEGDFMRGGGTFDPGLNPNAYPMTDETLYPSAVTVRVNGEVAARVELPDDPADHRGILSWHAQLQDRRLREAGSYGYLLNVALPPAALAQAAAVGEVVVRLEVDEALPGGLAVYGARFGRYPLDPTVMFVLQDE